MIKFLYIITFSLLVLSLIKDRNKTKLSLIKAYKSFSNVLPIFLAVLVFVGMIIAIFNAQFISQFIGSKSGWLGTLLAGAIGTFVMIPSFVAFSISKMLLDNGAGYMQIGAFISTLFMVQLASIPIEIKYLGKKVTIIRNIVFLLFSFVVAYLINFIMVVL